MILTPLSRLAAFTLVLGIVATTACVPLNRAKTQALAVRDTLAQTRDSLARTRSALSQRDSVFMPLTFSTPDSFLVAFETTKGRFDVMAHRAWAPVGSGRFYELVHRRFYDSVIVYRIVKGFVAQFGINGDPAVSAAWNTRRLADEPNTQSNTRGRISFARGGAGTRTTQVFINYGNNVRLDTASSLGYPPFGEVVRGMEVVDSLYAEYGGAPSGRQGEISRQGNAFLRDSFPRLDMIRTARIIQEWRRPR
jgi:peptidyl-prolyl cis-trans isomerase A (cyclophilin A)